MNIANLIPYLLNKITKVETGLSTIDFTPYQAKSEQNQANGYVGLDGSTKIGSEYLPTISIPLDPSSLKNNIEYMYDAFLFRGISNSTSPSYVGFSASINAVSGGSPSFGVASVSIGTSSIFKPYIRVSGSSIGGYLTRYVGFSASLASSVFSYGNNLEITYETVVSIDNNLTDRLYSIGIGQVGQSSGSLTANGIYLRFSQNNNSGNIQIAQIKGSVVTVTNTSTAVTINTRNSIKIIFNTSTNIASFYFNRVLIGTITVDISSTTIEPFFHLQSLSATQTTTSSLYIHNIFMQIKYL